MPGVPPIPVEAWTGPLGLEPTPELFVWHLVLVFRECYRVLRDDGVMWVVIGDSYDSGGGSENAPGGIVSQPGMRQGNQVRPTACLQPGDLVGIPGRLQFALQAAGWIVRNDPPWHKVNPMPESVSGQRWERCRAKVKAQPEGRYPLEKTGQAIGGWNREQLGNATWNPCPGCPKCEDNGGYVLRRGSWRHTRAHETVLMCVKSMGYWADQEVVRISLRPGKLESAPYPDNWHERHPNLKAGTGNMAPGGRMKSNPAGRNPRSVLAPKPESWSGPHYAAFPTSLIAPLIRATCPSRCCPVCGAGWSPVVEREIDNTGYPSGPGGKKARNPKGNSASDKSTLATVARYNNNVLGYRPACSCGREDWRPGIVLDCFCGSGTTLQVAKDLMLSGVGLDLAHTYLDEQAKVRAQVGAPSGALDDLPLFNLGIEKETT
jgi:DNA modification methylase